MFAIFDHLRAVDEYVFHANRVLMRFLERRPIGDRGWIKHNDIREHSFFDKAAMIEPEIGCRQRA
jgi:hypothetical protein